MASSKGTAPALEFCDRAFWETSYEASTTFRDFEWYLPLESYLAILQGLLKGEEGARVLNVGCGTSALPLRLWDVGLRNVTSIDIAPACIADMKAKSAEKPGLVFSVDDALALSFGPGTFDFVLDKATSGEPKFDLGLMYVESCLYPPPSPPPLSDVFMAERDAEKRVAHISRMFTEAARVLRPGGLLAVITRHRPTKYAPIFERLGWRAAHVAIPAPRVYHGKVHLYVVVVGAAKAKATQAAWQRLRAATGMVPLSRAALEAEDSGGSDDDSDEDDEDYDGEGGAEEEVEEDEDEESDDEEVRGLSRCVEPEMPLVF